MQEEQLVKHLGSCQCVSYSAPWWHLENTLRVNEINNSRPQDLNLLFTNKTSGREEDSSWETFESQDVASIMSLSWTHTVSLSLGTHTVSEDTYCLTVSGDTHYLTNSEKTTCLWGHTLSLRTHTVSLTLRTHTVSLTLRKQPVSEDTPAW